MNTEHATKIIDIIKNVKNILEALHKILIQFNEPLLSELVTETNLLRADLHVLSDALSIVLIRQAAEDANKGQRGSSKTGQPAKLIK